MVRTLPVTDYYLVTGHVCVRVLENGVEGVRVVLYGTTLDTPGRRELLQMQV